MTNYRFLMISATETSPYSAILSCLSIAFRQLLTEFSSDLHSFVGALKARLGPQLSNIQLLFVRVLRSASQKYSTDSNVA